MAGTAALLNCGSVITPACIMAMYNITAGRLARPGNTLGIFEFGDAYAQQDLNMFYNMFAL
jgi:tripeptidyl-peptidase-1